MSTMILDYTNCLAASIGATHGLTDSEIDTLVAKFPKHHENIEELRASGECCFFDLPHQDRGPIEALVKANKGAWESVVVIGLGGAAISAQAVCRALLPEHWNLLPDKARKGHPKLFWIDNLDPSSLEDLGAVCDPKKTLYFVVSRSGNTAETNALFLWLLAMLKKKVGKAAPTKQVILATDPERSPLIPVAKTEGLTVLPIPANCPDRFNVLGPAGLLPAALCGIDIGAVMDGGKAMDERCRHDKAMQNPAYMHSLIHYLLTRKRRKTIHATMAFSNRLAGVVDWYDHLLSVSLGKMLNRKGKAVHVGPGPASCIGPSGNYGQMQLYQEGPFDKVTTFITVADHGPALSVPADHSKVEALGYLGSATAATLIDQAYIGAVQAITVTGRPNMSIRLPDVSAESVGGLVFMLQLSTVMSAELYGIDPFNQPGVDANKQTVFAQLGRAGFEDRASVLAAYRQRPVKSC